MLLDGDGDGDGVRLRGSSVDYRLDHRGRTFAFVGAERLAAFLLGQPSLVLNMMARRARGSARCDICTGPTTVAASNRLLFSVSGDWQVGTESLGPGEGVWWAESPHLRRIAAAGPDDQLAVLPWDPS